MGTQRRISSTAEKWIHTLHTSGVRKPADIRRVLLATPELTEGEVPSVKTVRRVVTEDIEPLFGEPWSVADASGEEAALVLPVLGRLVQLGFDAESIITVQEAKWIAKLKQAQPDMPPWETYVVGRAYVQKDYREEPFRPLDVFVAIAPWRDPERALRYVVDCKMGALPIPEPWVLNSIGLGGAVEATRDEPLWPGRSPHRFWRFSFGDHAFRETPYDNATTAVSLLGAIQEDEEHSAQYTRLLEGVLADLFPTASGIEVHALSRLLIDHAGVHTRWTEVGDEAFRSEFYGLNGLEIERLEQIIRGIGGSDDQAGK